MTVLEPRAGNLPIHGLRSAQRAARSAPAMNRRLRCVAVTRGAIIEDGGGRRKKDCSKVARNSPKTVPRENHTRVRAGWRAARADRAGRPHAGSPRRCVGIDRDGASRHNREVVFVKSVTESTGPASSCCLPDMLYAPPPPPDLARRCLCGQSARCIRHNAVAFDRQSACSTLCELTMRS